MPHRHQPDHRDHGDHVIRWARLYDLSMRLWSGPGRRWRAAIADQAGARSGAHVLDVASGPGQLALVLARQVGPSGSVDGIDASAAMVTRARVNAERSGLPVRFQTGRAQQLPFDSRTFDVVVCTLALHHIAAEDRATALAEMFRVLRPAGRLLLADVHDPGPGWRTWPVRQLLGHAMAERPLDQAVDLAAAVGFADITRTSTPASWIGSIQATRPVPGHAQP